MHVAKAIAIKHALNTNLEAVFHELEIETYNMKLYEHLKKGMCEPRQFGNFFY